MQENQQENIQRSIKEKWKEPFMKACEKKQESMPKVSKMQQRTIQKNTGRQEMSEATKQWSMQDKYKKLSKKQGRYAIGNQSRSVREKQQGTK